MERFGLLLQDSSDVFTVTALRSEEGVGAVANLEYVSPSVERVLGWKPEDMQGRAAAAIPAAASAGRCGSVTSESRGVLAAAGRTHSSTACIQTTCLTCFHGS